MVHPNSVLARPRRILLEPRPSKGYIGHPRPTLRAPAVPVRGEHSTDASQLEPNLVVRGPVFPEPVEALAAIQTSARLGWEATVKVEHCDVGTKVTMEAAK